MKKLLTGFLFISIISNAFCSDEFISGRLINKRTKDALAAKCAVEDESGSCLGYQFYLLHKGDESKAQLLNSNPLSLHTIEELKVVGPIKVFKGEVEAMIELLREDNSDQSLAGEIIQDSAGYFAMVVVSPIMVGFAAVATPFMLLHKGAYDHKINKLLRSIEEDKVLRMNIEQFQKLVYIISRYN